MFIKAVTLLGRPLVIVLEDLQWIDASSLDLITALIEASVDNLMLIINYRDDEINDGYRLEKMLQSVKSMNISITEIKLKNVPQECINEFVSDTFHVPPLDSYLLSSFVYKKSKGNPFFIKRIINRLVEKNLITYSPERCSWLYNASIFERNYIAENIEDLLREKILSLDVNTQRTLKIASCFGASFSLLPLTLIISNKEDVDNTLAKRLIIQLNGSETYCFVHDQVQQAAKSLLLKNSKLIYLHIAKMI